MTKVSVKLTEEELSLAIRGLSLLARDSFQQVRELLELSRSKYSHLIQPEWLASQVKETEAAQEGAKALIEKMREADRVVDQVEGTVHPVVIK